MPIRVQAPDGSIVEFPDGMADDQIANVMRQEYGGADTRPKSQALGLVKGAFKPLDNAAMAVERGLGAMGVPVEQIGDALGGTAQDAVRTREQAIAQDPNRPGAIGEMAGNIAGTLPTLMLPGGPLVQGGAAGALLSDAKTPTGLGVDVALGAAGNKLGDVAFNALAKGAKAATDPAVKMLREAGVKLTPGMKLGGAMKAWEDRATSQPFVGGMINKGREAAQDTFDAAAIARALDPIGEKLSPGVKMGHDAVAEMGDKIGAAYDALVPNLRLVRDQQLNADLSEIGKLASVLPREKAKQLANMLKSNVFDKFDVPATGTTMPAVPGQGVAPGTAELTGESLKHTLSKLGADARAYAASMDPDQKVMGQGFAAARTALHDALERANPQAREALRSIDTAFANGLRVEKAASAVGAKEGKFTPQQLASAVKAMDSSGRKKAVSRGEALMQDLSSAGQKVLQSSLPDSGTAGRMAWMNPLAAGIGAAGVGGYQASKVLAAALEKLPPKAAAELKRLAGPGGFFGGVLASQGGGE